MAKIKFGVIGVVHTRVNGIPVYLAAGDEVPEGASVRGELLDGVDAKTPEVPAQVLAGAPERPKNSAKRSEWVAYYEATNGESADGMTVAEIIDAVG